MPRLLFVFTFLLIVSCDRDDDIVEDQLPAKDYLVASEEVMNEMETIARMSFGSDFGDYEDCAQKSQVQEDADVVTTLRFDGTKCVNGKVRTGALVISLNPFNLNVLIQPDNFVADGVKIEGVFSFAPVIDPVEDYTRLIVMNGRFTSGNDRATFTADRKYRITDDIIEVVSGSYFITEATKVSRAEIKTMLTVNLSCEARMFIPVDGTIEIETTAGKNDFDFGNGNCDAWQE